MNAGKAESKSSDRYRTRDRASIPRKVFLFDPATGKQTEDYLEVISSLSDAFRLAKDIAMQEAGDAAQIKDPKLRAEKIYQTQLEMKSALVTGWNLDMEFTKENVVAFLRDAPQVQNVVVDMADDNQGFFSTPSADSKTGPALK